MILEVDAWLKTFLSTGGLQVPVQISGVMAERNIEVTWWNPEEHVKRMEDRRLPYLSIQPLGFREDTDRRNFSPGIRLWRYKGGSSRKVAQIDRYPEAIIADYQLAVHVERSRHLRIAELRLTRLVTPFMSTKLSVDVYDDTVEVDIPLDVTRDDIRHTSTEEPGQDETDRAMTLQTDLHAMTWIFHRSPEERVTFWNRAEITFIETFNNEEETFTLVPT